MQLDFNSAILLIGAIAVLAALLMGGLRLFGNKFQSTTAAVLVVLLGLSGAASVVWVLTQAHPVARSSADVTTRAATTPMQPDPLLTATSAFLACVVPIEPAGIPDGATASIEQMRAARARVFDFDAATAAYNNCLDSTVNDGMQQYTGVAASTPYLQILKSLGNRLHNAALEKDQTVANQMNQQIRIFKARHSS
jgi:hypothetical protein